MTFCSFQYFLFLPVLFLIFSVVGQAYRPWLLLAASFLFYGALGVPYLLLTLLVVAVFTYAIGILLGRSADGRDRKGVFWLGVTGNLLVLCSLKYAPFLSGHLARLAGWLGLQSSGLVIGPIVSIGVSYYVFQAISYLIDIFLGVAQPERNFGYFALYLSFFPKLLQGPIERAGDLLPQLRVPYEFNYENVRSGLFLFTWGMFKKLVIADRLGLFVDLVYGEPHVYSGGACLLATYIYAFQLYFDFSGYTDMAIGIARLFNINLTQNFNSPYMARSVADFWRRWHISFSRWLLDYLFKPLQMHFRNWKNGGVALALIITFLVSGLWHGANWGFIIWGGLHGLYLAVSVFYKPFQKRIYKISGLQGSLFQKIWQTVFTFNLVCLAWVFFRAASVADAWYIITHTLSGIGDALLSGNPWDLVSLGKAKNRFLQSLLPLSVPLIVSLAKGRVDFFSRPRWFRWSAYYLLVYSILYLSVINAKSQFVYFRF